MNGVAVKVGEGIAVVALKFIGIGVQVAHLIETAQVKKARNGLCLRDVQGLDVAAQTFDTFDGQLMQGTGFIGANARGDGVRAAGEGGRDDAAIAPRGPKANRLAFQNCDRYAFTRQFQRRGQPRKATAYDDRVRLMRAMQRGASGQVAAGLGVEGLGIHQASRSIQTGTWSDGLSRPRTALSMPEACSRSAAWGDSNR